MDLIKLEFNSLYDFKTLSKYFNELERINRSIIKNSQKIAYCSLLPEVGTLVKNISDKNSESRIVDVGCGSGIYCKLFNISGINKNKIIGLDVKVQTKTAKFVKYFWPIVYEYTPNYSDIIFISGGYFQNKLTTRTNLFNSSIIDELEKYNIVIIQGTIRENAVNKTEIKHKRIKGNTIMGALEIATEPPADYFMNNKNYIIELIQLDSYLGFDEYISINRKK